MEEEEQQQQEHHAADTKQKMDDETDRAVQKDTSGLSRKEAKSKII